MGLTYHHADEDELIRGCLRGDSAAQCRLYQTYAPAMYTICCRYLKDPMMAEDALVVAFTRIFERIRQYKGSGSFEAWIKTIIIRESLSMLRKNQHLRFQTELDAVDNSTITQSPDVSLETEELLTMIRDMPTGYRTVFNMYAIDGYSHKEIAEHLGISENTSKSQLSRARTLLQQQLAALELPLAKKRS